MRPNALPSEICRNAEHGAVRLGAPPPTPENLSGAGKRFAIVVARFNDEITRKLAGGAIDTLVRHDVPRDAISEFSVPGSFELPLAAQTLAQGRRYAAVICIGCLIRGDTPHFEHISAAVSHALMQVGLETGVPVIFGVITVNTIEQALARCGPDAGNKGAEAARAALEVANLLPSIVP